MDEDTVLTLALVGIGAYVAYSLYKKTTDPWSAQTGSTALSSAGLKELPKTTIPGDTKTYFQSGDTIYGFSPVDFARLNFAQRQLITLDKIIPGTWLTDLVLT